jgi:phage gp36-like protein
MQTIYATVDQFKTAFGFQESVQLTNLENPGATAINAPVLTQSLMEASAEIDGYLRQVYSLPLAGVCNDLVRVCLDIARYRLDSVRPREDVRKRYEDAIKWLTAVAKGLITLLILDANGNPIEATEDAEGRSSISYNKNTCPTFTKASLAGFTQGYGNSRGVWDY